jgi:hypothetical protein
VHVAQIGHSFANTSDFYAKSPRRPPLHHETDFENPNETSGVIQLDRAAPGPRSLLGQLDRPKEEVRRPLGLPLPNSHLPQDAVRDRALRGRERQPPDKPVVVRVKPAVLDLGKCTGTKMVPRAKHGGVRDQKKNPGNVKERIQPLHAVPVASRAQLHGRWTM